MDFVDQLTLVIRLEDLDSFETEFVAGVQADALKLSIVLRAINIRFANTEHIEVWAIDDKSLHDNPFSVSLGSGLNASLEKSAGGGFGVLAGIDDDVCPSAVARYAFRSEFLDAVPAGDDQAASHRDLAEHLRFARSEGLFSLDGDELGAAHADSLAERVVEVDMLAVE